MNHTITAPANAPKNSAIDTNNHCSAGNNPKTTFAKAIAGFKLTPPKMNNVTVIPNAHVVIANKCPVPAYFVFFKTSSQCTPTPKIIIRAVPINSDNNK